MSRKYCVFALASLLAVGVSDPPAAKAVPSPSAPATSPTAQPGQPSVAAAPETCTVTGSARMAESVIVYGQQQGGAPVARFTGGNTPLRVGPFPSQTTARVRVSTGTGIGSFRIDGYVDSQSIPLVAARDIPLVPDHVWISAQQTLAFAGAAAGKLQVRKLLSRPFTEQFTTWASCDYFKLRREPAAPWRVPGNARGYHVEQESVPLFAQPNGDQPPIFTLTGARGMLVWSTETRGDYVHLIHHSEIVINAWGRVGDFSALPPGEMSDRLAPPDKVMSAPQLRFDGPVRLVRTNADVTLLNQASPKAAGIGKIEPGTETYVLDVVAGWAHVLPKSLHVAPPGDGQFWVKATDLGL